MERNIMTYQTPMREILRRYTDESERVIRWTEKAQSRWNSSVKKLDIPESLIQYVNRNSLCKLNGYEEWTSPKNGDTWLALCMEYKKKYAIAEAKYTMCIPVYYWQTAEHYGVIHFGKYNMLEIGGKESHIESIWCITSHCISRIKERMGVGDDMKTLVVFLFSLMEYSVAYHYMRGKKNTLEIANPFGVFRTDYKQGTCVDMIRTFIAKEELSVPDRNRYNRMWKMACEKIFNNPNNNETGRTESVVEPADGGGERPHSVEDPDQARAQRVRSMLPPIDRGMEEIIRRAARGYIQACDR